MLSFITGKYARERLRPYRHVVVDGDSDALLIRGEVARARFGPESVSLDYKKIHFSQVKPDDGEQSDSQLT